jgi:hypothetical protein
MHKPVWALAIFALIVALPEISSAEYNGPKKYAVDFTLGGGYSFMGDVNDFIGNSAFTGYTPETEINIGAQFGLGIAYRSMEDFGWEFGYNRIAFIQNYRMAGFLRNGDAESFVEQSIKGAELYALPTWYWDMFGGQMSFGAGPAVYWATLDRSVDLVLNPGSHLTSGGFSGAESKSLGVLGQLGLELNMGTMTGLIIQVGGRSAIVSKLRYYDEFGNQEIVWRDPSVSGVDSKASYPKLEVDYSGAFLKLTLRKYFTPSSDWRSPRR